MTAWNLHGNKSSNAPKYMHYEDRWDWRILHWLHDWVRPLFVKGVDRNEDYICGHCGRPVLTRLIFCSKACSEADLHAQESGEDGEE